jgi:hypothetical protein
MRKALASPNRCWTIEVSVTLPDASTSEHNAFWDAFLEQIEANGVRYGGLAHGYIEADSLELGIAARSAISSWLSAQAILLGFNLGPVVRAA